MKKGLFLIFTVLSIFFITDNVYAEVLPKPSVIEIENHSYGLNEVYSYSGNNIRTVVWYDFNGYATSHNNNGLISFMDSRQNFWYDNMCQGKEISINVKTLAYYSPGNFYEQSGNLKLWNGEVSTTCSLNGLSNNGNVADWSCYGIITDRVLLTFENISIGSTEYYNLAIYTGSSYKCDATNSDILNNLTTIGDKITNNQNQNTQNIINNQNQNQQQTNEKLDGINNSLNNPNVEGGTGSSFFNDFNTTDNGGISNIITAPLVAINSMLDNTCSPMSVTYKGKEVSLPCGTEFWTKASTIQDYLNWFEGGILVYLIIRKLYKLIESMKNPDDDRVEVMDL